MDVVVGNSARWGRASYGQPPPIHLVVAVASRAVPACTGGAVRDPRDVPFDRVLEELNCGPCRKFWNHALKVDRSPVEGASAEPASAGTVES